MSDAVNAPPWLEAIRQEVLASQEWAGVFEVAQQLAKKHPNVNGDEGWSKLTLEDKETVISLVEDKIRKDPKFAEFSQHLSKHVDRALQEHVQSLASISPHRVKGNDLPSNRRLDLDNRQLTQVAGEGAGYLLARWPDQWQELKAVGIRGLPHCLRNELWKLRLLDVKERNMFLTLQAGNRLHVLSDRDPEISKYLRSVMDAEFGAYDLVSLQVPCKSVLSYLHKKFGGPVENPLHAIVVVLVWSIYQGQSEVPVTVTLVERSLTLLDEVHYSELFDIGSFLPRPNGLYDRTVKAVCGLLEEANPDLYRLFLSCSGHREEHDPQKDEMSLFAERVEAWKAQGKDRRSKQKQDLCEARYSKHVPWNFTAVGTSSTDVFFHVLLPVIQNMFAGYLSTMEGTCCLWDCLVLFGQDVLPHLATSFLLCLEDSIKELVPPSSSLQVLEAALNFTQGIVDVMDVQTEFERHFWMQIRKAHHLRKSREDMLNSLIGSDQRRTRQFNEQQSHTQAKVEQARVHPNFSSKDTQTEMEVTEEEDPQRILSEEVIFAAPAFSSQAQDDAPPTHRTKDSREPLRPVHISEAPVQRAKDVLELWYARKIFSITIPNFSASVKRLSLLADKVINLPENEELFSAVVQHEKKIPCPVARFQGSNLRLPKTSNVDVPLFQLLASKYPRLENDFRKPMMRCEIIDPETSKIHQFYLSPLRKGDVHGTDAVSEELRQLGIFLSSEQVIEIARCLESYSAMPPRDDVRRTDPRAEVKEVREGASKEDMIGFDVRVDARLNEVLDDIKKEDMQVLLAPPAGKEAIKRLILSKMQTDMAAALLVSADVFHPLEIHEMQNYLMAEFNLHSPYNSFKNRTTMQIYDDLVDLVMMQV
eukprot:768529-Hanusia_phi.AAC.1